MKIRRATTKDLKKIAEFLSVEYSKPPYKEKWTFEKALQKVKKYYKNLQVYVAVFEDEVAGFIAFQSYIGAKGKNLFVKEFVVSAKFQGKGFGKALLKFTEEYAKKRKLKMVSLMSNTESKAFKIYNKLGWKVNKKFVYMFKKIK